MSNILDNIDKSSLGLKGQTPAKRAGAKETSTLHYLSSINGKPNSIQKPSQLDLDGKTPKKYLDNFTR